MVQKEAPGVQTVAKAVDLWLFEGVLREESEKLQDRKLRIKLHPLKVWGNEPVEEITTLSKVPAEKKEEKDVEFKQKLNYDMNNSRWCNKVSKFSQFTCGQKHGTTSITHDKWNAITCAIVELYANLSTLAA